MSENDEAATALDSGWPTFYRSEGLYEVLPGFVARGHGGNAAAVDTAFAQTTPGVGESA